MKLEIALITDPTRKVGFELAGINEIYSSGSRDDTMAILQKLIELKRFGIIMIADHLLPKTQEFQGMMMRSLPAIITVPTSGQSDVNASSEHLREFIKRAIGISIQI